PAGSELELLTGPLADELAHLAADGVQSLLLEGGPMLASSFLRADLVDKVLLFIAPRIAGAGVAFTPELPEPIELRQLEAEPVGDDVLLTAYVHEP
ncbi:MAG TPA: dihydrofolate reductase family protein, partial [Gaiellaceae bacterium]|nr:dihydrofolate reductase family protein [Gaiellaceae bacterium]